MIGALGGWSVNKVEKLTYDIKIDLNSKPNVGSFYI
jgi:hypothetical protein